MKDQKSECLDAAAVVANLASQLQTFVLPKKIWVSCSGGLDSSVLLFLLWTLQKREPSFGLGILHVNYALRGEESDREEAFVRHLATAYGCDIRVLPIDPSQHPVSKTGIQEWARTIRYDWFSQQRAEGEWIAVAHHKDDLIETFFARLCRGHSLLAVSGMQAMHNFIWRPLLDLSRPNLLSLALQNQLKHCEDSSNSSLHYTRNLLRQKIFPELDQIFPGLTQNLWQHATDLHESLISLQAQYPMLICQDSLVYAEIQDRPPFLARHEIQRYVQSKLPEYRPSRHLLLALHAALVAGVHWHRMLEPGCMAVCQEGHLKIRFDKINRNERWEQYRAALLDETPDTWSIS